MDALLPPAHRDQHRPSQLLREGWSPFPMGQRNPNPPRVGLGDLSGTGEHTTHQTHLDSLTHSAATRPSTCTGQLQGSWMRSLLIPMESRRAAVWLQKASAARRGAEGAGNPKARDEHRGANPQQLSQHGEVGENHLAIDNLFCHVSQVSSWDLPSQLGNKSLQAQVKAEHLSESCFPDGLE